MIGRLFGKSQRLAKISIVPTLLGSTVQLHYAAVQNLVNLIEEQILFDRLQHKAVGSGFHAPVARHKDAENEYRHLRGLGIALPLLAEREGISTREHRIKDD